MKFTPRESKVELIPKGPRKGPRRSGGRRLAGPRGGKGRPKLCGDLAGTPMRLI